MNNSITSVVCAFGVGTATALSVLRYLEGHSKEKERSDTFDDQSLPQELFYAKRVNGDLPTSLRYIDKFISWNCAIDLLQLGLFRNSQEISESVGVLHAIEHHVCVAKSTKKGQGVKFNCRLAENPTSELLPFGLNTNSVMAVVVGDGSSSRTACLLAMHTQWKRILAIDPALRIRKRLSSEYSTTLSKEGTSAVFMEGFTEHEKVRRVYLSANDIREVNVIVDPTEVKHIIVILPHSRIIPDEALRALCFSNFEKTVSVSVIQLPCCSYVWHDRCVGKVPDIDYMDSGVCAATRTVRVWRNVYTAAKKMGVIGLLDSERGTKKPKLSKQLTENNYSHIREERSKLLAEKRLRQNQKKIRRAQRLSLRQTSSLT